MEASVTHHNTDPWKPVEMIPGATVDWAQDCPYLRIVRSIFLLPRGGSSPFRIATPARGIPAIPPFGRNEFIESIELGVPRTCRGLDNVSAWLFHCYRSVCLLPRGSSSPLRSATPARMGSCRRARMRRDSCVMVRVGSSICAVHTTQNRENQSNQRNRGNQDNQENQANQENKQIHKKQTRCCGFACFLGFAWFSWLPRKPRNMNNPENQETHANNETQTNRENPEKKFGFYSREGV